MAAITICPTCDKEIFQGIKKCLHCGHYFETGSGDIPVPERTMPNAETNTAPDAHPATADSVAAQTKFRIGACVWQSLSLSIRNIVPFFMVALVVKIPVVVIILVSDLSKSAEQSLNTVASVLAYFAITAITYSTISELRGNPVPIMETFQDAAKLTWKTFASSVVAAIAIILTTVLGSTVLGWLGLLAGFELVSSGFIILVMIGAIPGFMLYSMYWIVVPVVVGDDTGIFASLSRSAALTKNNRWKIFAVFLLSLLLTIIPFAASFLLLGGLTLSDIDIAAPGFIILMYLASTFGLIYLSVVQAKVYHDLRSNKEGLGSDQLASVFN